MNPRGSANKRILKFKMFLGFTSILNVWSPPNLSWEIKEAQKSKITESSFQHNNVFDVFLFLKAFFCINFHSFSFLFTNNNWLINYRTSFKTFNSFHFLPVSFSSFIAHNITLCIVNDGYRCVFVCLYDLFTSFTFQVFKKENEELIWEKKL